MNGDRSRRIEWVDVPALLLFIALGVIVLLQFVTRYVLNDSLAWTEEIARYLLIGVAYAGSITALRKGEHIFLELTYRLAPAPNIKPLAVMADIVVVGFHIALTVFAVQLTLAADRRMISVDLPKNIVYGFVALTLLAATVFAIRKLIFRLGQSGDEIIADIERAAAGEEIV